MEGLTDFTIQHFCTFLIQGIQQSTFKLYEASLIENEALAIQPRDTVDKA
jgi:regulator of sigma D